MQKLRLVTAVTSKKTKQKKTRIPQVTNRSNHHDQQVAWKQHVYTHHSWYILWAPAPARWKPRTRDAEADCAPRGSAYPCPVMTLQSPARGVPGKRWGRDRVARWTFRFFSDMQQIRFKKHSCLNEKQPISIKPHDLDIFIVGINGQVHLHDRGHAHDGGKNHLDKWILLHLIRTAKGIGIGKAGFGWVAWNLPCIYGPPALQK